MTINLGDDPDGDIAGYDGAITPILYWCPDACGRQLTEDVIAGAIGEMWREYGIVRVGDAPRPGPNLLRLHHGAIEQATRAERADNPRDE